MRHSAQVPREAIDQVLKKNPAAAKPAARPEQPRPAPAAGRPVRVTMGAGGDGTAAGRSRVTISGQWGAYH